MADVAEILETMRMQDGGLIEIYVDDIGVPEWESVIAQLAQIARSVAYRVGDTEQTFNGIEPDMFDPGSHGRYAIAFEIGKQTWTTGFFSDVQIDLQGDPREIQNESDVGSVVDLLGRLHRITGRAACLYAEGAHDMVSAPPIVCVPGGNC